MHVSTLMCSTTHLAGNLYDWGSGRREVLIMFPSPLQSPPHYWLSHLPLPCTHHVFHCSQLYHTKVQERGAKMEVAMLIAVREAPLKLMCGLFGHCPNINCTPITQTGTQEHFICRSIWANLSNHHLHKCHKASWQALTPTLTKANAHLNFNFHCISAPNHPGKHFDPPTIKQMPIWTWTILL